MANRMKLFSLVYIPMIIGFYVVEPAGMPRIAVTGFWLTMLLAGIVYGTYPKMNESGWTVAHFWITSCGLPLAVVGYLGVNLSDAWLVGFLQALGSYSIMAFFILFLVRILIHMKQR